MKRNVFLACLCMIVVLAPSRFLAQVSTATLTGSWQLTFSPTSPTAVAVPAVQFGGLATFISDGTVVEADTSQTPSPSASSVTPPPPTPGHGIWQPGPAVGNFYIQFVSLMANRAGAVQSKKVVTITGMLDSATGNMFHGTYNTQVMGPTGQVLSSTAGTVTGQRMVHPLLP